MNHASLVVSCVCVLGIASWVGRLWHLRTRCRNLCGRVTGRLLRQSPHPDGGTEFVFQYWVDGKMYLLLLHTTEGDPTPPREVLVSFCPEDPGWGCWPPPRPPSSVQWALPLGLLLLLAGWLHRQRA